MQSKSLQEKCGQSIPVRLPQDCFCSCDCRHPYPAKQQMSFDGARSLLPSNMEVKPATAVELWQLRLRPTSNKQMTTILTTFIVVSGLLTTSTYPATYTSAIPGDQTGGKAPHPSKLVCLVQTCKWHIFPIVGGNHLRLCLAHPGVAKTRFSQGRCSARHVQKGVCSTPSPCIHHCELLSAAFSSCCSFGCGFKLNCF